MEACREIRPDGMVLPKCELPSDVQAVIEAVGESMRDSSIYALIETPLGLLRAEQIATVSKTVVALAFGAEDFCTAAGIPRTQDEVALVHARCSIVMVAKAHGLAAIDSPNSLSQNRNWFVEPDYVPVHWGSPACLLFTLAN
jgi:citrate lyase subunit beta/citryl-CoA lyase